MRAIASWGHMLPDSVTYEPRTATDAYGDATFGTATTYRARVVGEQKKILSFTGAEVVSAQTVYLAAAIVVQPSDRVTLSTGLVGSTEATAIRPPILGAKRIPDQNGTHHVCLYLG